MNHDDTISLICQIRLEADDLLIKALREAHVEGIVPSHGAILFNLFAEKKLPMNILAARIGKTPQTVTTLVQKLRTLGYLETEKSEEDKRTTLVSLTEEGEKLQPVFMNISQMLYEKQYMGMEEDDIAQLRRLLKKMSDNLQTP